MPTMSFSTLNFHSFTFEVSDQTLNNNQEQEALYGTDHLALYKSELILEITLRGEETVAIMKRT